MLPDQGGRDISLTTLQFFVVYLPGRAWRLASSPIMNYDHVTDEWTIPINIAAGKTVIMNGRPWKFGLQYWHYVESPDDFGPDYQIRFSVSPVVALPW